MTITIIRPNQKVYHLPEYGIKVTEGGVATVSTSYYALVFGATTTLTCANTASIQDLPSNSNGFCVEGWFALAANDWALILGLPTKAGWDGDWTGWTHSSGYQSDTGTFPREALQFTSRVAGTVSHAVVALDYTPCGLDTWVHRATTFNASDSKLRVYQNGTLLGTSAALGGTYKSDAGNALSVPGFLGKLGWIRISSAIRYTEDFTPDAYNAPPTTDADTALLWRMTEGSGTSVMDASGNGNTGTFTNGTWLAL